MNHHVIEDTAGAANIRNRRRLWVAGRNAQNVWCTNLAAADCIIHTAMVVVKASNKTNLQLDASLLDSIQCHADTSYIMIYRLFAEDMLAGSGSWS